MTYAWQHTLYPKWKDNDYGGVIKAVTGAGKTHAGCIALQCYLADHPDARPLILVPRNVIGLQWIKELDRLGIPGDVKGYQQALSHYAQGKSEDYTVCIADECHNLLTDVQGRLIRQGHLPEHILGLSATPDGSETMLGGILLDIGYDHANVSPFTVHYATFPLTTYQQQSYDRKTERVKEDMRRNPNNRISWAILNRRNWVYELPQRLDHAIDLINSNKERRIMVFAERKKQLHELSTLLERQGITHALHLNGDSQLQRFIDHDVDIVLSCKMLQEGFDDPTADVAIILSTATSARSHIQTIGRVIRPAPGKTADVHVLLAQGTTDDNVTKAVKWPANVKVVKEMIQ